MKRLLIAAILPVLMFSCAKEENTNPSYRKATCEDSTDEGKFEFFSLPEKYAFLSFYKDTPIVETEGLKYQFITTRDLFNNAVIFEPTVYYKQSINEVQAMFYLPYGDNTFYSWSQTTTDTSVEHNVNIFNARKLYLTPGCYRLYYVFSLPKYGKIITKGHYDLRIRN